MKKIGALLALDFKNVSRDAMLVAIPFTPIIIGLALRLGLPVVTDLVMQNLAFELSVYYDFIMGFMLLMVPMLYGFVIGFILLDERDEQILNFIAVTPLTKTGYLFYRVSLPIVLSFVFFYVALILANLLPFNPILLLPVAVMAALEAPMWALLIAAFAANKIEGLAFAKGLGVLLFAPIGGYFVHENWQIIFGLIPPFWVTKAFVASYGDLSEYWFYTLVGIAVHIVYLWVLLQVFKKKVD